MEKGKERGGTNWGREERGRETRPPQLKLLATPLISLSVNIDLR